MSTLIDVDRVSGLAVARVRSIREVSLVGRPPVRWTAGDLVAWAGRSYRVVGHEPDYVHLRPDYDRALSGQARIE